LNGATRRSFRAFGVEPEKAMGKSMWELFPQLEHSRFGDELRRAAREQAPVQFVDQSPLSGRWFEVHVYPTGDGVATYAMDVTERRLAEERLRFISEASRVLGSSLDYEDTLQAVARLSVPLLGDYCVLDLLDTSGVVRRVAAVHADPSKEPFLEELKQHPPHLDAQSVVARVLRTGVPEMGTTAMTPESPLGSASSIRLHRLVELLRPHAFLCVPLLTNGQVLGTILCVSSREQYHYAEGDLEIAEELARRVALAVLHARTHEAERMARLAAERASQRLREAQEISTAATASQRLDEMLETLVDRVRLALQADSASVLLLSKDGHELVVRASLGIEREASESVSVPLGEGFAGRVAAVREPVIVRDLSQVDVKSPFLRERIRSIVGVPLLAGGRLVGVLHCGAVMERDFTDDDVRLLTLVADRVAHAIERAGLLENEQQARTEAEKANRAKMDFLAMMSHELRTPLNAIAGYAELLELGLRGPVTELQQKDLQSIRRNERHLLSLIEEVLSFAKLDAGRVELDLHNVRVQMVIESVVSIVAPQLQAQGHTLEIEPADPTLAVNADVEKLQQILVNLLSNAIKFTDRGGHITISAHAVGREVAISVRDTGIGIAAEHHQRIFEPFVQLDVGLTRKVQGTGLGLSISRELARAMRGELEVESALGAGATFTLKLPRSTLTPPEWSSAID
jgi:signal transduction histidine kinase